MTATERAVGVMGNIEREHDDSIDFEAVYWAMTEALWPYWQRQESMTAAEAISRLVSQHAGAVEALCKLADLHHRTLTGSKKHDPENQDWTECECKSCRLAQPYAGGR